MKTIIVSLLLMVSSAYAMNAKLGADVLKKVGGKAAALEKEVLEKLAIKCFMPKEKVEGHKVVYGSLCGACAKNAFSGKPAPTPKKEMEKGAINVCFN